MKVSEAVERRISVRAFLPDPVPREVIERVLRRASRAPSGGNLQPWIVTVVTGETLDRFREIVARRLEETEGKGEPMEYDVYPPKLHDPYRTRRFQVGEAMYGLLGIERENKAGRLEWFANNYRFFGAPAALFVHVDRRMGAPQWSDLGMFLQTVMLLLQEEGYDSCAQEAWARFHETVDEFVGADPETMLFCGMAIGKADWEHPVNALRAERAPLEEWVKFM
ncbi:MAG: nitroreductase [Pseudomonadota bacterium]